MIYMTFFVAWTGLVLPLLNAVIKHDTEKVSWLINLLLNLGIVLGSSWAIFKFFWHRSFFENGQSPFDLAFTGKLLITIIAVELIILLINHFIHWSNWFTVTAISELTWKSYLKVGLLTLLVAVAVFSLSGSYWATSTFGLLNPEQIIYNLKQPMEGANESFLISFLNGPALRTLIAILTALPVFLVMQGASFRFLPKRRFTWRLGSAVVIVISLVGIGFAAQNINIVGFYHYFTASSNFIEENYVDPKKTKLTFPNKKRNLIYIYVESLESSSIDKMDGGQMTTNLLPELTELSDSGIHFSDTSKPFGGAHQFNGTGWTIAGMVAQTSGLPLKVPVEGNDYANSKGTKFLPGATSLNDILANQGYQQTFLLGSDATFGGRRAYFTQHGNVKIDDYLAAKKEKRIPQNYKVWWGYEDSKLFEYARDDLGVLSSNNKPFNLTMLTANTHHIGGYPEKDMPHKYDNQYSNVISYTDTQLVTFVNWLKQQPYYDNTTVIIHGDHLSMDANYYKSQNVADNKRRTFNLILNSPMSKDNVRTTNRTYGTFDMFPTTLAAMGVKIKGNRLGLGTNLLSDTKTIAEKYGFNKVNDELAQSSKFYNDTFMYANK